MTAVITYAGSDDLWGIAGTGIAGEQAFYRRSFAGADTYFGGWETTEYEKDQITKSLVSVDIDRDGCDELAVVAGAAEPFPLQQRYAARDLRRFGGYVCPFLSQS